MQVESIAECSLGAFCNTFDLHLAIIGFENQFLLFILSGRSMQVLLYVCPRGISSGSELFAIMRAIITKRNNLEILTRNPF